MFDWLRRTKTKVKPKTIAGTIIRAESGRDQHCNSVVLYVIRIENCDFHLTDYEFSVDITLYKIGDIVKVSCYSNGAFRSSELVKAVEDSILEV